ncbi:MAG: tetratricopeptide repeat protein [Chloroflexi bacterium]|nr:tetratricopeptide repeat protein [Chloroflexota bacterium]
MGRLLLVLLCALIPLGAVGAQAEVECAPPPAGISVAYSYYVGLGDAQLARQAYAAAVVHYTCALQLDPGYAPAYARRGYAQINLGDGEAAMNDYNRALELDEALVEGYINRGALYVQLGNFGLAIGDFTLAAQLDPTSVSALNNRAIVHAIEGNYAEAIADLEAAIALDPNVAHPYATLAAVYSALAAENYQRFVAVSGSAARLPAGTPPEVLVAIDDSLRNGNYTFWLTLVTPGE